MELIRSAIDSDMPALTDVYAYHVRNAAATFEIEAPGCSEMNHRRLEIISHGLPYLVAEVDGRVAGYAYAGRYRVRPAYRFTVEDSIYIHPEYLSRGLGRQLLTRLIDLCGEAGYRQMVAIIGDSGNTASIRLHERRQFRKVGVLEGTGRKFGRWIDTVFMQRALDGDPRVSQFKLALGKGGRRTHVLRQAANFIQRSGKYRWVGLYDVNHTLGEVWHLVSSGSGVPAYPVFALDKGLTGVAIRESRTINIGDVTSDPHYLTAFPTTRSEIIVPIFDLLRSEVIGTIDVESENPEAFPDREQVFLEDCADLLRGIWTAGNATS